MFSSKLTRRKNQNLGHFSFFSKVSLIKEVNCCSVMADIFVFSRIFRQVISQSIELLTKTKTEKLNHSIFDLKPLILVDVSESTFPNKESSHKLNSDE